MPMGLPEEVLAFLLDGVGCPLCSDGIPHDEADTTHHEK